MHFILTEMYRIYRLRYY